MKTTQSATYRIAGLITEFVFPGRFKASGILPSFEPFRLTENLDPEVCCRVEFRFEAVSADEPVGKMLSDVSVVWGERFRFYETDDSYITTIRGEEDGSLWKMTSGKDFSHSVIVTQEGDSSPEVLSWLMMVAFGQAALKHRTILIHASVIACQGKGFAFLGKSGTGKSTHSRLWLENIGGAELLNDDNPAIRLENDGNVNIYGTPWSGKTACYKNMRVPLQALVRLRQAPDNSLMIKSGLQALVCVLPSCTAIRWNKNLFSKMTDTVEAIVQRVLVAELECLPNREAARLCYDKII